MFEEYQLDDFADDDLSKLTRADTAAINKVIAENTDPRIKTVGDRIHVWDTSRLTNAQTYKRADDHEDDMVVKYESIVIEDRLQYHAKLSTLAGEFTKVLDLKIWNKKLNKVYLTSSDFVKLV